MACCSSVVTSKHQASGISAASHDALVLQLFLVINTFCQALMQTQYGRLGADTMLKLHKLDKNNLLQIQQVQSPAPVVGSIQCYQLYTSGATCMTDSKCTSGTKVTISALPAHTYY